MKKKTKHFKKTPKPLPVETHGLPNNVRIGYKDVKIRYVRPDYKKWELTDCFGEYDYRQNVIQVQHDLCGQEMANTIFHEIMQYASTPQRGGNDGACDAANRRAFFWCRHYAELGSSS